MPAFLVPVVAWFGANPWAIPIVLQFVLSLLAYGLKTLFASPRLHGFAMLLEGMGFDKDKLYAAAVMILKGKFPSVAPALDVVPSPMKETPKPVDPSVK